MDKEFTIALLIDSDNISSKYFEILFNELKNYGVVTYNRIYGDFTKTEMTSWKSVINKYGITPMQQFAYTTGKNSTDSSMIIDAMDILYSDNVNAFCIATSDSDFTRLAKRLKESNIFVIGAGENKTPQSFVNVCDRFLMLDQLFDYEKEQERQNTDNDKDNDNKNVKKPTLKQLRKKVENIIDEKSDKGVWVNFANIMNELYKTYPQFNCKLYGARTPSCLFEKYFDLKNDGTVVLIKTNNNK